jgi:hypothetical protein
MKAKVNDQLVTVTIHVDFETAFKEITVNHDVFAMSELNRLTAEQEEYVLDFLQKPWIIPLVTDWISCDWQGWWKTRM